MIKKVKGTQDLLAMTMQDAIYNAAYTHFARAGFAHIETPIIEHMSLFKRSVGESTDIVGKEMYTLTTDDTDPLCLRPEGTAGTMRAFLESATPVRPWNVFTYGPMFRHERPQKGRYRQFSQFNLESIGITTLAQEVCFLSTLYDFFTRTLCLPDTVLSINYLGTKEDRARHKEALKAFLSAHQAAICATCTTRSTSNILRIFDCKNEACQALYQGAPLLTDFLSDESARRWQECNDLLDILSINRIHNPLLVRGLDYYNTLVFEFSSPHLGAQNAFCGGGAYELATALGQKEAIPAIGAAFGIERLLLLLEAAGNPYPLPKAAPRIGIITFEESLDGLALLVHQTLLRAEHAVELLAGGIKKGMKKANALGCDFVIIIGEEERQQNCVKIKNMQSGEESVVSHEGLVAFFA